MTTFDDVTDADSNIVDDARPPPVSIVEMLASNPPPKNGRRSHNLTKGALAGKTPLMDL
jgi:hypothetical protein